MLLFIRQARSLSLSLEEVKRVLGLQRGGAHPCSTVSGLLDHHIRDINATMRDLRQMRATLVTARDIETHGPLALSSVRRSEKPRASPGTGNVNSTPHHVVSEP